MTSIVMGESRDKYCLNFEETELRLGLPGGGNDGDVAAKSGGKRGFSETVDLKLNLLSKDSVVVADNDVVEKKMNEKKSTGADPAKPPTKAQVVGWPPVRSFRKNIVDNQKNKTDEASCGWPPVGSFRKNIVDNQKNTTDEAEKPGGAAAFVKVSMDGAPYLRKVDLKTYKSYHDLSDALGEMFSSFTIGNCGSQGMKDFMNESKLIDLLNGSEYVPTYEDKDGDWMLVGDVPWQMFVNSCKRLRIMKGSEAIGLAPRAVEKCKNRS